MAPLLWLGAAALSGWAGWKWFGPKPSVHAGANVTVGDKAQPGDELWAIKTALQGPSGTPPISSNIAIIRMQIGDATTVQGPLVGGMADNGSVTYTPQPVGSFTVKRSAIAKIVRNGVTVAEIRGASGSGAV